MALSEGLTGGVAMAVAAVMLAVLGLSPSLSWIPETVVLGAAVVLPVAILGVTGLRAARRADRTVAGAFAGWIAGAIGGSVGGLAYVSFGKPALNVAVGLCLGAVAGGAIGGLSAAVGRRKEQA